MSKKAATAECDGCHYIFAKPDMQKVTVRSPGKTVQGRKTYRYNRQGQQTGYSQSQSHRRDGRERTQWLCDDCFANYQKRSCITALGGFFIIAAVISLVSLCSASNTKTDARPEPSIYSPQSASTD